MARMTVILQSACMRTTASAPAMQVYLFPHNVLVLLSKLITHWNWKCSVIYFIYEQISASQRAIFCFHIGHMIHVIKMSVNNSYSSQELGHEASLSIYWPLHWSVKEA